MRHDVCSALPYENDRVHGWVFPRASPLFIASRWAVASSSLCPPERNKTPGTAAGHVRRSAVTVAAATSARDAPASERAPGVTMFGLRIMPSSMTPCCTRCANTHDSTRSVTSAHLSMPCAPSVRISGSTMGTRPFCWHIAAYLARHRALSSRH